MTTIFYVLYYVNEKTYFKIIFMQTITLKFRYTLRINMFMLHFILFDRILFSNRQREFV